ncbi:MAG: PDZ domain-containing protein [Planctomycetes bacterium]|nr:PDZ domain-containing protein [Planctomycetota bacterium]
MRRFGILLLLAVFIGVVICGPVAADDAAPQSDERKMEALAFADRTLAIIEVILAQHVDPPPRQQLILQVLRALSREADKPEPIGLGRRVSQLSTPEQCRDLVGEFWTTARNRETYDPEALDAAVFNELFAILPGGGQLLPARERAVEEQLANNRYVGIGIAVSHHANVPTIHKVVPGGPADAAGARDGDSIVEIDGQSTAGKPLREIVNLLRGPAGSEVTIVLQEARKSERRTRKLTRGEVPLKTVSHKRVGSNPAVASIRIERIAASTPHELRQLEPVYRGVDGIVLDLRGTVGGELHHAVLVADALLDGGAIGRVRQTDGTLDFEATPGCLLRELPLAVLVEVTTSGAGEWLAAAVQDNRRATLIGRPTAGRAYVSESVPIPGGDDVLVLATGILERADGGSLVGPAQQTRPPFAVVRGTAAGRDNIVVPGPVNGRVQPQVPINSSFNGWPPPANDSDWIRQALQALQLNTRPAAE